MTTITKVKAIGYCDHRDHAVLDSGVFVVKKNRPIDIHGVWKATEAYDIMLDVNDKEMQFLLKRMPSYASNISTQEIVEYLKTKGLLPNERLLIFNNDWKYNFLNQDGFIPDKPPYIRKNTTELIVFAISDFVKCEPTNKEKTVIEKLNNRTNMQKLNSMVLADNILKTMKDRNYAIELHKVNAVHDAFLFHNKKAFNDLVKDALEYYLNDIVLKDLGCKIKVPEQKSPHCYKYDDVLCYVGDIELLTNEGE